MPQITTTLSQMLSYIAPGILILLPLRHHWRLLNELVASFKEGNYTSLIIVAVLSLVFGVISAGLATLLVPGLARWYAERFDRKRNRETHPITPNDLDFGKLFTRSPQALQMFLHHSHVYQEYANISVALLIGVTISGFSWIERWYAPGDLLDPGNLSPVTFFVCLILAATLLYSSGKHFLLTYKMAADLIRSAPSEAESLGFSSKGNKPEADS